MTHTRAQAASEGIAEQQAKEQDLVSDIDKHDIKGDFEEEVDESANGGGLRAHEV